MLRQVTLVIGAGGQTNENAMKSMAKTIEVTLKNITSDLNRFQANQEDVKNGNYFPLNELILVNRAILDAIASIDLAENGSEHLMDKYLHETPLSLIIEQTLRTLLQKNPA